MDEQIARAEFEQLLKDDEAFFDQWGDMKDDDGVDYHEEDFQEWLREEFKQ